MALVEICKTFLQGNIKKTRMKGKKDKGSKKAWSGKDERMDV